MDLELVLKLVIFALSDRSLHLFLPRRGENSSELWRLPSGTINENEALENSVQQLYCSEVGIENLFLEQLETFVYPARFIAPQTIHIVYYGMINRNKLSIEKADNYRANWLPIMLTPTINENDGIYVTSALKRLQDKVRHHPVGFYQLPKEFELSELQSVYEMILDRKLDRDLFRSKLYEADLLIPLNQKGTYKFNVKKYFELTNKGYCFNI